SCDGSCGWRGLLRVLVKLRRFVTSRGRCRWCYWPPWRPQRAPRITVCPARETALQRGRSQARIGRRKVSTPAPTRHLSGRVTVVKKQPAGRDSCRAGSHGLAGDSPSEGLWKSEWAGKGSGPDGLIGIRDDLPHRDAP